ncbi:MAG: tetratricopeptide repeat protein [Pseudomonadota bacterium]
MQRGARLAVCLAAGLSAAGCTTPAAPPAPQTANAYANFLVGRLADLQQDHSAAADHYYEALERDPADPDLIEGALSAALAAGEEDRARSIAAMAHSRHIASAHASMVRAADALVANRWRQARDEALRVRGGVSDELAQHVLLLWARTGEGHLQEGFSQIGEAASAEPFTGLFAYQRAMALDYAGRTTEALAVYQEAEHGGLWLPSGIERHADLLARTGAKDQALEILRRADGRENNPVLAADARRLTEHGALDLSPLTPARGAAIGLYGASAILLQQSEAADGLAAITLALMLDPGLDSARLSYAEAQVNLGHSAEAREALSHISENSVLSESARVMDAWVLLGEGKVQDAIDLARNNAQGGGLRARRALADIERSSGRYADAEPLYTALVAEQPNDWKLYFARGAARERLHRWSDAEADLRRALELSPEQPEVLNYLGYSWIDRGEHLDEGLTMVQHAAEIRPHSGAIIDSLGWAYFKLGRFDDAVTYLERAAELTPADATVNDHLGDAYWRVGKRIEARFQWRQALAQHDTDMDQAALEQKIAEGLPPLPASRSAHR